MAGVRDLIRERLHYAPEKLISNKSQREKLEGAVSRLMARIDGIEDSLPIQLDRTNLLLQAHHILSQEDIDPRQVAMIVALFDGALTILQNLEAHRHQIIEGLSEDREKDKIDFADYAELPDYLAETDAEIGEIRSSTYAGLLENGGTLEHRATPFEAAYIRMEADGLSEAKWKKRKRILAAMMDISPGSVASSKAHAADSFNGRSVEQLIAELSGKPELKTVNTSKFYTNWSDNQAYLDLARKYEPANFIVASAEDEIPEDVKCWILVVVGLAADEKKANVRKQIADLTGYNLRRISPVTAYLTGQRRAVVVAEGAKGRAIAEVEALLKPKDPSSPKLPDASLKECTNDDDPDYDNLPKQKGWREPEQRMIERAFGRHDTALRGRRILLLETPALHEWKMLQSLYGAEEQNLTIVERDPNKAEQMQALLPRATIVNNTLQEHFGSIAARRLAPEMGLWSQYGVTADDSTTFVMPGIFTALMPDQRAFKWLKDDHMFDVKREPQSPFFVTRKNTPSIPSVESEAFDLISLDTKGVAESEHYTLLLLFKLGLLRDGGVLCTNFLSQREVDKGRFYDMSIMASQALTVGHDFNRELDGALGDRRSIAIPLRIIEHAFAGADVFGARAYHNPYSNLYRMLEPTLLHDLPDLATKFAIKKNAEAYGDVDGNGNINRNAEQGTVNVSQCLDFIMDYLLYARSLEVFGAWPAMGSERDRRRIAHIGTYDSFQTFLKGTPVRATVAGTVSHLINDILYFSVAESLMVTAHEGLSYRHTSKMQSDFFHFKSPTKRVLEAKHFYPRRLQELMDALEEKRSPRGIQFGQIIPAILTAVEIATTHYETRKKIVRVDIS